MPPTLREHQHGEIRSRVVEHAHASHGIFRRSDLDALDIDPARLRTFLRRGWWTKLHHGVYIDSDVLAAAQDATARTRIHAMAAIIALRAPAYAFGPSAALVHGLVVSHDLVSEISIVRPPHNDQRALRRRVSPSSTLRDVRVHSHHLNPVNITEVDRIPVIDAASAALTTAAESSLMWAVATLDSLLWSQPTVQESLEEHLGSWRGLSGLGTVRKALHLARPGAQTPLESLSRVRLMEAGLPEPLLQLPIHDRDGLIGLVDMAWPDMMIIGEADGLLKYHDRSDLIAEKLREDRLRALGWIVVRWTWDEILRTPEVVVARIRRAMAQASQRYA